MPEKTETEILQQSKMPPKKNRKSYRVCGVEVNTLNNNILLIKQYVLPYIYMYTEYTEPAFTTT